MLAVMAIRLLRSQYLFKITSTMLACKGAVPHSYTEWFVRNGGVAPQEWKYPYLDRYVRLIINEKKKFLT